MGKALKIGDELSAEALRREARREKDGRAAARMYAIAHALDGLSRAEAARLAGMERQALRDAVVRYNAEGLSGLHDRPKGRPQRRLRGAGGGGSRGGDRARAGPRRGWLLRLDAGRPLPLAGGRVRQDLPSVEHDPGAASARLFAPEGAALPPQAGRRGAGGLQKGGLADQVATAAARHPDKRIELWFADEARVGNKGRVCHRWWRRGQRPPGVQQLGYLWAYIFTAIRPATGEDVTLVLPAVNTAAMQVFLDHVAASRPADTHLVMVLDGAGWHVSRNLVVPPSITLVVPAALQPRAQSGRTRLALPARALPLAAPPALDRCHHRRLLPRLDAPRR